MAFYDADLRGLTVDAVDRLLEVGGPDPMVIGVDDCQRTLFSGERVLPTALAEAARLRAPCLTADALAPPRILGRLAAILRTQAVTLWRCQTVLVVSSAARSGWC